MKRSIFLLLALFLASCSSRVKENPDQIQTLQIIDRHGFNETISHRERLKRYDEADFLAPQPYEKAVRVYGRGENGLVASKITSYHENGHVWQYLEVQSGRAQGVYKEWYPNGQLHVEANVIEGTGDLTREAQESWVFDGDNLVYDQKGGLLAKISYDKGSQVGEALYYHANGNVKRRIPYHQNEIHGQAIVYSEDGDIVGETSYVNGKKQGKSYFAGGSGIAPFDEVYEEGLLIQGAYYDFEGQKVSEVIDGNGYSAIYREGKLRSMNEYVDGLPQGDVQVFDSRGRLESRFAVKEGLKHGEEIVYYQDQKPKLSLSWFEDNIQGVVRTWYENGQLQSEREMYKNKKHGMAFAWYRDGHLMTVEEYENDKLVKGAYYKRTNSAEPISRIDKGEGVATLYDADGYLTRRVKYQNGRPIDE